MPVKPNTNSEKVTKHNALFGTKYFKGHHLIDADKQSILTDQCKQVVTTLNDHLSGKKLETKPKKETKVKRSVKTTVESVDGKKKIQNTRQSNTKKSKSLAEGNRLKKLSKKQ